MILNLLKRFNDALLNDSVDFATKLGLCTLELRRLHRAIDPDLLYCYKIVFGLVNVNFDDFFALSTNTNTRGHKYKMFKPRCTASIRQKFFVDRVGTHYHLLQILHL